MNSYSTWISIDNWQWRCWEACIGILATYNPPLIPAYTTSISEMKNYLSNRFFRSPSSKVVKDSGNPSRPASAFTSTFYHHPGYSKSTLKAAYTVSIEASRIQAYRAGEDRLAMRNFPGDTRWRALGSRTITRIDIENKVALGSQSALSTEDRNGEGYRYFV